MPTRKSASSLPESSSPISIAEWVKLMQTVWLPVLGDMMGADAEMALFQTKLGADARERIYNRFVGRPVEQIREEKSMVIQFLLRSVSTLEQAKELPLLDGECEVVE